MKKTILFVTLLFGLCMFLAGPALALPFTASSPTIGLANGVPYTMTVSEATLATHFPHRDVIEPIVFTVETKMYREWDPIDTHPDPNIDNQDFLTYEVLIGGNLLVSETLTGFGDGFNTISTGPLTYNKLDGGDIEFSLYSQVNSRRELWDVVSAEVTAGPTPEPCTLLLLGSGLLGAAGIRRKRSTKRQQDT